MKNHKPNKTKGVESTHIEDRQFLSLAMAELSHQNRPYQERVDLADADSWLDDAENAHYVRGYN